MPTNRKVSNKSLPTTSKNLLPMMKWSVQVYQNLMLKFHRSLAKLTSQPTIPKVKSQKLKKYYKYKSYKLNQQYHNQ